MYTHTRHTQNTINRFNLCWRTFYHTNRTHNWTNAHRWMEWISFIVLLRQGMYNLVVRIVRVDGTLEEGRSKRGIEKNTHCIIIGIHSKDRCYWFTFIIRTELCSIWLTSIRRRQDESNRLHLIGGALHQKRLHFSVAWKVRFVVTPAVNHYRCIVHQYNVYTTIRCDGFGLFRMRMCLFRLHFIQRNFGAKRDPLKQL